MNIMLYIPVSVRQLLSILAGEKCRKGSSEKVFLGINSYKDAMFCFFCSIYNLKKMFTWPGSEEAILAPALAQSRANSS